MATGLTEKQRRVLDFIIGRVKAGRPPTVREIGEQFGMRSTGTVRDYLSALEKKGYIRRSERSSRGIELLGLEETHDDRSGTIPIIGRIAAGQPVLAVENEEGRIPISRGFFGNYDRLFALRISGSSMIEDGIFDGDLVVIREQSVASNGEIVAVCVDNDEATLKRYYREDHRIRLQPSHPGMSPIYLHPEDAEAMIVGRVVGLIRRYVP